MSTLEEIEHALHLQGEHIREIRALLRDMQKPPAPPAPIPEVYLSASEVCRLLKISVNTLNGLVKYGAVLTYKNTRTKSNKYLLAEILWIKEQKKYVYLTSVEIKRLIVKKEREFLPTINKK